MPVDTSSLEPQTAAYEVIKQTVPAWLTQASASTREALKAAPTHEVDWLDHLNGSERRQLQQYTSACAHSQNALDQAMAGLPGAEAFAKPLLAAALKAQFGIEPDLDSTYLDLRKPVELGAFGIRIGSFSVLTLSLLQAALHNFEEDECASGAFAPTSRFKRGPAEHDASVTLGMSIEAFLSLCRRLDIGAQYQARLTAFFHNASGLRDLVIQAQKDALQAAAYTALLKHDIGPGDYAVMGAVIAGEREIRDNGKPVWFNDLSLMGLRLSGCTAFVAVDKYQHAQEVLVYIPHDPQHPLKKYPNLQALQAELTRQLMADAKRGTGLTAYQGFLKNSIAYTDQPTYLRRLTEDASDAPGDPYGTLRIGQYILPFVSATVSLLIGPKQLPPAPTAREPIKDPNFYIQVIAKREPWQANVELWGDNFDKLRDKLIADARGHAVPTADVDAAVRARKVAALESAGLLALNLVSMFVPGLGEVMMAVMAAQLLYETFEGVVEWHEGDREAALGHLADVAENLVFIGVMAAGGRVVHKALSTPAVVESLKPVRLPNGQQKLWKADLTPYRVSVQLAPDAKPDVLGLYAHQGQSVLPLEGDHFAVAYDAQSAEYRIQHPTRPQAYAPRLAHNHEGAWQHELEHPLTWDAPTTQRRLGQPAQGLSAERLRQACEASGIDADALRAGHLDQEPVPLALADTLQRFKGAEEVADFIAQMKSESALVYAKADPVLQMDLLRRRGMLPGESYVVLERDGTHVWSDPVLPGQSRQAIVLAEGAQARGELLQEVLGYFQADDPALSEFPSQASESLPERARQLRHYLGAEAQSFESALVEERYKARNFSANPDVTRLQGQFPSLPSAMAEHMLKTLDDDALQRFRSAGQLPPNVLEQAQWQVQELRLTRAWEGLFADSLANADTQRLQALGTDSRANLRTALLEQPLLKPAYDPSMRLLGGGRGVRQLMDTAANALRSPAERVRRLFPDFTEDQTQALLHSLGSEVRSGLSRLEDEYTTLKRDLKRWVRDNAPPVSTTAFDRQGGFVKTFADAIKRCWRRQTNTLSIVPGHPLNLPALTADFSHVEALELANTPWNSDARTFLNNFRQLKRLSIREAALSELPEGLEQMSQLTQLQLRKNRIRLTPQAVEQLGRLNRMEWLDLSQNPLGLAPDLSNMPHLRYVFLRSTELEHWPTGLRDQSGLRELNLEDNHLRTIPPEHLEPPAEYAEQMIKINQVTSIRGNHLSAQAEQALDDYWRRLSHTHPELLLNGRGDRFSVESPAIAQVRQMNPNYDIGRCRQYIWNLGEDAEGQLSRQFQEYSDLKAQLDGWVFSGGGARQRYVRMNQVLENLAQRDDRVMARTRILACWRQETPMKFAADGTPIGLELDLSGLALPSLPDLEADFSHVASLKLTGMNLSTSPEGFLSGFQGVRWLDLSNNQLRELPPAVGQMHGLTRLFLDDNQIRLTAGSARVLAERTTLRALWMSRNPLGMVPDFSRIPDIRSVRLSGTDIPRWPAGLESQTLLDEIDLSHNQLTTLPEGLIAPTEQQLERSVRLSTITNVGNNPLTEATLQQVRAYAERLEEGGQLQGGRPLRLISTALGLRSPVVVRPLGAPFERWARGFDAQELAGRGAQWSTLRDDPGSQGFFEVLADMEAPAAGREDLQRRVWEVIDSITEPSAESAALREDMFTWAGRAACCDRAALSFSNLEVMQLVYRAKAAAGDAAQGPALLKLARGLFRLDEVEKTALQRIAERTEQIRNDPQLSDQAKRRAIGRLDEVEVRLAYRYGLKDDLELPGQPGQARFIAMGNVTPQDLTNARERILALNNSPQERQALLSRDFWKDYVTSKHRVQFDALSKPFHEQLAQRLEQVEAGTLSRTDYDTQARGLQDQLGIAEADLIERLTTTELEEYPQPGPPEA
ncbi:leucine rich repeat (LRR) protein [Pseudomonas tolaasii NCPPB 2192]|uniref:RING-type E3 ubiquitin transferase n=1 Tax=Pseudomonas tolaasii NCPPB 2192 TaxID=564423 RepID=A0ABX4QEX7_PSETO|nr:NEL-type E3 ubiquitin ligase domain-containing protein [Pseudomonas tolaasii]ARB30976.1 hypothetical protein B5P22_27940 [Pseudomonas tolaasii]KAB0474512.1 hypothetical protein F7R12_17030 [Pseudomonas tolaasii]PKA75213.1 leucine rich repeat (LRR) protein [Pseudomonas tolaasii NCPPB 2192]